MNPISFRFDLIPFLKEHILPEYKKFLTKEITQSIRFSDLQIYYIELYINFLSIVNKNKNIKLHLSKNEVDINVMCPVFESMEKHISIFQSFSRRLDISDEEKDKVSLEFDSGNKMFIKKLLSNV